MEQFRIKHNSQDIINWDEESRILIIKDTGKVTFSIEPVLPMSTEEGNEKLKAYKFDMFNPINRASFYFFNKDKSGKEITGTRTEVYYGNKYTVKGKPGYKGKLLWVEFFKEKSLFESSNQTILTHNLGLYLEFQRPAPVIESVEWLDPKTKKKVEEKHLGQYVILRIKSKHLEQETVTISLWEHDGSLESVTYKTFIKRSALWKPFFLLGSKDFESIRVSNEDIDPETGEVWEGTVQDMDFGFAINQDITKEKLNSDGSLDILVHLNPAWVQDREGKDNMDDSTFEGWNIELCIKIDHPRLPNYDEEISANSSKLGLFYGKYLNVSTDVETEEIPLETSKMVATIIQYDSPMEAKGYEPCKFTYVSVTEGDRTSILFQEAEMVATELHGFKVLVGSKENGSKIITIDLDNPNDPDPKKKLAVCPDVKASDPNNTHKSNTFNTDKIDKKYIKTPKDNQLVLEAYTEPPSLFTALKNAWLPNIEPIPLKVLAQTCRYQRWIDINCYPDLQYELSFKSSPDANLYEFKSKSFITRDYLGKSGFLSQKKKDIKGRKKKEKKLLKQYNKDKKKHKVSDAFVYSNFQICFEYALAGNKLKEIAVDGEHPIFDAIDTIMYLSNKIADLCFTKEKKEAEKEHDEKKVKKRKKKRNRHLKKIGKTTNKLGKALPFSVSITPPTFAGSVAWQLAPSEQEGQEHELGTKFALKAKADPLIEIEGRLDLLFVITKVPYIGQAVKAITTVADGADMLDDAWNWLVEIFTDDEDYKIDINVDYHLDLVATGNFKIEAEAITYHTIDGWGTGEIKPLAEFTFGIEAGVKIRTKIGKFEACAEVYGKAFGKWTVQKGKNDMGEKVWQITYDGLYVIFYANLDYGSEDDVKKPKKNQRNSKEKFKIHGGFTYETQIN